jgi:2-polyprenyl-6-methoxyphenol hydroxylase-like FAD-dependent oxidoreductase
MTHVLIVGAGPAGAGLAHLLAHRGVEVTLLERQRDFAREFRGEVLMPSGIEVLEQMGLAEALRAVPCQIQDSISIYLNRRQLFEQTFSLEALRGHFPSAISQPGLLEILVGEAGKSPNFRFERGVSVKDLWIEGDRVVGVRGRSEEGERSWRADLVIGADGRASVVRKHGGFVARQVNPPMDVVWCKMPVPTDWEGAQLHAGRGHLLIGYRSWDGNLQLAWVILKGTFGELKSRGIDEWVAEMAQHVPPALAAHLRTHADSVTKPFLLDSVSDCVDRWSVPGALLIGDAAHTMSPVGGQGLNIALRDTIVAANHLVPVLTDAKLDVSRLAAALHRIEAERMPEVALIQRLQAQPPKVMLSRAWWGEPVRSLLGLLLRSERLRSVLARPASVFPFGSTEVRLRV